MSRLSFPHDSNMEGFLQHNPNLHNLYICSVFSLYTGQVPGVISAKELFQFLFDQSSHDSNTESLISTK